MKQLVTNRGILGSGLLFLLIILHISAWSQTCQPIGWATQNGGTTGGGNATPVTVTNLADFQSAAKSSGAKVIYVQGTMGSGVGTRVQVTSNKTIFGLPGSKLYGGIDIKGANNVIIRNLTIQGPGAVDVDGVDGVLVDNSTNVWLDHLTVYDGQDGNLDIVNGSNYISVTWCKFYYTSASKNHQFSNLIGNSDSKTSDRGKLKVTMQYNWWADGVKERMPRVRFGQVHVVNNLFNSNTASNCVRAGLEADLLVESNVFIGVSKPIDLYENDFKAVTARNNIFSGTSGNTSGRGTAFTPPYTLTITPASGVESMVKAGAGATLASSECGSSQPNQSPVVSIISPANGSVFTAPASIVINANASDPDGSISKVEFYNGTTLLGSDNSATYTYTWSVVTPGAYSLTAKAYDDKGAVTTSQPVNITVSAAQNQKPVVTLTSPLNNSVYTAPATINLSASASDPDGTISKVEFFQGNTLLFTDNTAPYSYSWTNVSEGSYSFTARATDNSGESITSSSINITVNGSGGNTNCGSAVKYGITGYATLNGGTTGGQGGTSVTVSTGTDLQNAIKNKGTQPLTIYVNGLITPQNSSGLSKIDIKDVSDISIIGVGTSGELNGIGIKIMRASNIIIQNLKIHHVRLGDKDCISIEGPAHHIWVDHCELYNDYHGVDKDYYDGLLDAKAESEYITYSWNYLHDSWKASLAGSSESDTYDRKITYHHNLFENINSRLPLYRGGNGHLFNNYYKNIESTAINSRLGACLKIENNYFENVKNPYVTAYSDVDGYGDISGNVLVNSPFLYTSDERQLPSCNSSIPYNYAEFLNTADAVPGIVTQYAGVGKLNLNSSGSDCNKFTLSLTSQGNGTVVSSPHQQDYDSGSSVTITATPAAGWIFSGWSGDASGNQNPLVVSMNSNKSITAVFTQSNAPSTTIQAETACDIQGVLEIINSGFNGSSYVNTDNFAGATIRWAVNVPDEASYSFTFRYANGGTSGRAVKVLVNGLEQTSVLDFPVTGGWSNWATVNVNLNLWAGNNFIEIVAISEDGVANIDEFTINSGTAYMGSCILTAADEMRDESVMVFPNPFTHSFFLKGQGTYKYTITDLKGVVQEEKIVENEIDAGNELKPGIYILKVESSKGIKVIKVNKQ